MRSIDTDDHPTLAAARRALRADLLARPHVERCAERAADMGLTGDAEVFARALAGLARSRELLGRRSLPAGHVLVDTGHVVVDHQRVARVWRVGQEGVAVERLPPFSDLPDALLAAGLAGIVVLEANAGGEEPVPVGIAFIDSDRLFWARGADDWHVDARASADAIVSAARFFPDDDTRALLMRVIEREPGDRVAYGWLKELLAVDVAAGRHRPALRALQVLHRLDPRDPDVLELIAASFEAAGSQDRARALAEQARTLRRSASSRT